MDRLTIMRSFVGVTQSRSFTQTARMLGVQLVIRTARTVSLTDAGTEYAEFSARILDEMDREDARIRGTRNKPEGSLSVICPKWIGSNDVGEAIAAFSIQYPKIHIRFEVGATSGRPYEFLDQGFDVAFQTRDVRDCNLMLRKITDLQFALCAARRYLHRAGEPGLPADLNEHDCLVNTNDAPVWHIRQAGHDIHLKINDPVYSSNSYVTLRQAVLAGRGIAVLPVRLVSDELADGTLVSILPDCELPDRPLYALHSPGSTTLARVQFFLDFVAAWFQRQAQPELGSRSA